MLCDDFIFVYDNAKKSSSCVSWGIRFGDASNVSGAGISAISRARALNFVELSALKSSNSTVGGSVGFRREGSFFAGRYRRFCGRHVQNRSQSKPTSTQQIDKNWKWIFETRIRIDNQSKLSETVAPTLTFKVIKRRKNKIEKNSKDAFRSSNQSRQSKPSERYSPPH